MKVSSQLNEVYDCLYRVAVKAVIIDEGKVLLVKDSRDDDWSLPGGGVDHGEDLKTALVRELGEEINVPAESILGDYKIIYAGIGHSKNGIPRCNLHFQVTINPAQILATGEIKNAQWFGMSELEKLDFDESAGDVQAAILNAIEEQS